MNIITITIVLEDCIITVNIIPKPKVKANVRLMRIIRFNDLKAPIISTSVGIEPKLSNISYYL